MRVLSEDNRNLLSAPPPVPFLFPVSISDDDSSLSPPIRFLMCVPQFHQVSAFTTAHVTTNGSPPLRDQPLFHCFNAATLESTCVCIMAVRAAMPIHCVPIANGSNRATPFERGFSFVFQRRRAFLCDSEIVIKKVLPHAAVSFKTTFVGPL